jgi:hypothetical protein
MRAQKKPAILSVLISVTGMVLVISLIMSCGKENNASPAGLNTRLNIINVSPDVFPVDFYIALRKQNTRPYIYSSPSGYLYLSTLATPLQIRTLSNTTIFSRTIPLTTNCSYSVFITGLVGDKTDTAFLVTDTDAVPAKGRGKVRFINASARPVNIDLYANGTPAFQKQGFLSVSKYLELPAGIYDFKLYNTGTTTILKDMTNITIQDGRLYTLYSYGIAGRTDSAAFNANVITNR